MVYILLSVYLPTSRGYLWQLLPTVVLAFSALPASHFLGSLVKLFRNRQLRSFFFLWLVVLSMFMWIWSFAQYDAAVILEATSPRKARVILKEEAAKQLAGAMRDMTMIGTNGSYYFLYNLGTKKAFALPKDATLGVEIQP